MTAERTGRRASQAWLRALQVLGLIFGLYAFVCNVEYVADELGRDPLAGKVGMLVDPNRAVDGAAPVLRLRPDGVMAKAGVKLGDIIRFDHPMDNFRPTRSGDVVGFSRQVDGHWVHESVRAERLTPITRWTGEVVAHVAYDIATMVASLIGVFILWRGGGRLTTILLGLGLILYGNISALPPVLFSSPALFSTFTTLGAMSLSAIPWCFCAFSLAFFRDQGGTTSRGESWALWLYGAVLAAPAVAFSTTVLEMRPLPILSDGQTATTFLTLVGFVATLVYLARGWHVATPEARQRYMLLIIATVAIFIAQFTDVLTSALHFPGGPWLYVHLIGNAVLTGVVASGLFAYAILRQKVFDLGFAVNRTLVYGVVSAVLLAGFGLVEWAADHFLPVGGREKNALIDAGVALAIFLTFHRLRDGAERLIETLFFRAWREKEEALKAFLAEAPYFLTSGALTRAAVRALSHYGEGAATALYLPDEAGVFRRIEGRIEGLGAEIDPDDAALVALRARRQALEGEAIASLPAAALALPMLNRAELTGAIFMGPPPTGLALRPDEIVLLSTAAREIGQDLHALKVEQLEGLARRLAIEKAALLGQGEPLRGAAG